MRNEDSVIINQMSFKLITPSEDNTLPLKAKRTDKPNDLLLEGSKKLPLSDSITSKVNCQMTLKITSKA